MTVKERLDEFLKQKGLKPAQFEKKAGISNGYVKNIRNSIGPDVLPKILTTYPDLNKVWLLHGEGKMLNDEEDKIVVNEPAAKYLSNTEARLIRIEAKLEVYQNAIAQLLTKDNEDFMKKVSEVKDQVDKEINRRFDELRSLNT